jgi:hypothetical protein
MSKVEDQRLAILTLDFGPGDFGPTPGTGHVVSPRKRPKKLALTPTLSHPPSRDGRGGKSGTGHVDRVQSPMSKVEDQRLAIRTLDFGPPDFGLTPGRDTLFHREKHQAKCRSSTKSGAGCLRPVLLQELIWFSDPPGSYR